MLYAIKQSTKLAYDFFFNRHIKQKILIQTDSPTYPLASISFNRKKNSISAPEFLLFYMVFSMEDKNNFSLETWNLYYIFLTSDKSAVIPSLGYFLPITSSLSKANSTGAERGPDPAFESANSRTV